MILMFTKHGFNYIIACARLNVDIFLIIIEIAVMISSIITTSVNFCNKLDIKYDVQDKKAFMGYEKEKYIDDT